MWSLIRSDRSPVEDRRPIEGLTSKPRPNSEPSIFTLFSSSADRAPTARTEVLSDFHYINSYLSISRAASSDAQGTTPQLFQDLVVRSPSLCVSRFALITVAEQESPKT